MIDKELLDILSCPACRGDLELSGKNLRCKRCRNRYPIKEGIPVILINKGDKK